MLTSILFIEGERGHGDQASEIEPRPKTSKTLIDILLGWNVCGCWGGGE